MMEVRPGYIVEYKTKDNGFWGDFSEAKTALVSQEYLVKMLQSKAKYYVISCRWTNVPEYQINHDIKLPEYGF